MMYSLKTKLSDLASLRVNERLLKNGILIYYKGDNVFTVFSYEDFEVVYSEKHELKHYISLKNSNIYLSFQNKLKLFDLSDFSFTELCSTEKERIVPLDTRYCKGFTYNSSLNRNEILTIEGCEKIYEWADNRKLAFWDDPLHLFTLKSAGELIRFDVHTNKERWRLHLDKGIAGKRPIFKNGQYLLVWSKPHRLLSVDSSNGAILSELKSAPKDFFQIGDSDFCAITKFFVMRIKMDSGLLTVDKVDVSDQMVEWDFDPAWKNYYSEGKVYMSDFTRPKIGVFDLVSNKILWTYELSDEMEKMNYRVSLDPPVQFKNTLFVKDQKGTLWIFERD